MAFTFLENIKCDLCDCENYKVKIEPENLDNIDYGKIFSASGGVMGTQRIVTCTNCGLEYVNPRVKREIIFNGYSNETDELYVSQADARIKTFRKCLRLVNRFYPKKGKILDVGAAAGFFLKVAKDDGWETVGIEPSKWLSDWGNKKYNVNIKKGALSEYNFNNKEFDVITMWDVLEHTFEPSKEIQSAFRYLKKDGLLVINYPNAGSVLTKIFGKKWWFYLSVHLYYFTPKVIERYLTEAGFRILYHKRHFQTLEFGHLLKMIGLYNKTISDLLLNIAGKLKLTKLQIPYYASQATLIAKK
ncbi:MAG: class I SAM-dependent methyltransferase [Proteobacteria bacterium]|nr:class I SAM-dependent methyltransferase [Pseudomonadota bacterium]